MPYLFLVDDAEDAKVLSNELALQLDLPVKLILPLYPNANLVDSSFVLSDCGKETVSLTLWAMRIRM